MSVGRELATFTAAYGREGVVAWGDDEDCDVCETEHVRALYIDSSEGEYGGGAVCLACLKALVVEMEAP